MRFDVRTGMAWAALASALTIAPIGFTAWAAPPDGARTSLIKPDDPASVIPRPLPAATTPVPAALAPDDEPAPAAGAPRPLPGGADQTMAAPLNAADDDAAQGAGSSIDAASLNGVRPGRTTRDELHALWGQPARAEKIAGGVRESYAIPSLQGVRVTVVENVVQSVAIRLEKPMAVEPLAKRLKTLAVEPVDVLDEQGQLLGRAYPERGMLFGFLPQSNPPRVFQVVIEPIDAQPFLARAEMRQETRFGDALADVQQALALLPESGRAHWLHAEISFKSGALETALRAAEKAIELEPKEPEYRLTLAKILAQSGDYTQAIAQVRGVVEWGKAPHVIVARAFLLWGDFAAAGQQHDYPQAIKHHMQAIKLAEPLASEQKVAVRRAAKRVLIEAHLAVAHDVGWGRWQQKSKVTTRWIERATAWADDLVAHDQGSIQAQLCVHEKALAALAGVADPPDASRWIDGATQVGQKLLSDAADPAYKAHLAWRLAVALSNAAEIEAAGRHADKALAVGQLALDYFDQGDEAGKQLPMHDYLRGRLCYRLGAIHAIDRSDHRQGVPWFDRAVPLLESPVPDSAVDCGKQGETFVSMAVSYWEVSNRPEALRLTTQGLKLMEQAAEEGLLAKRALAVPYSNLASMYEQMGDSQAAKKFSELAARQEAPPPK